MNDDYYSEENEDDDDEGDAKSCGANLAVSNIGRWRLGGNN